MSPSSWAVSGKAALHVVGTAACNGLAFNAHQTWAFRRAELTCLSETPFFDGKGKRLTMGHLRSLPPRSDAGERLPVIAERLFDELAPALARLTPRSRVALLLCLDSRFDAALAHPRFLAQRKALEQRFSARLVAAGLEPSLLVVTCGHAGLAMGLADLAPALAAGRFDAAVVGGLESAYDWEVVQQRVLEQRIFDGENLDTCIPGEGGALALLTTADVARRLSMPSLGRLEGVAFAHEPAPRDSGKPSQAQGLTRVLLAVADQVRARKGIVDVWLTDLTTERYRTDEWQQAFPRGTAGVADTRSRFELLPTLLGDLGAATLPTAVAIAVEMFRREPSAAPLTCIACSGSVGSERGALLLTGPRPT